ncbi:hypothetical protein ACPUD2_09360 [Leuconostoc mesenteroides subsp. dextranicum]|nr:MULTISPECIES: hypothetical protein [Leuconostoc]
MHHYLTKYEEDGVRYAESWIQVDFFKWYWIFSHKKIRLNK